MQTIRFLPQGITHIKGKKFKRPYKTTPPGALQKATFEFPLEPILSDLSYNDLGAYTRISELLAPQLHHRVIEFPQIAYFGGISWCADFAERALFFTLAELPQFGTFRVYCPQCQGWYAPPSVTMKNWEYYKRVRFAGGGRSFYCFERHLLLSFQDWIS